MSSEVSPCHFQLPSRCMRDCVLLWHTRQRLGVYMGECDSVAYLGFHKWASPAAYLGFHKRGHIFSLATNLSKGDPAMFSYFFLKPKLFFAKGPRPISPKCAIGLPVSPPRSSIVPMPQACKPTYVLKPHIFRSHCSPILPWLIHSFIHYEHFSAQVNIHHKCANLSNKNVLSNFLKEFLLKEESFNLAGRSFQIVGPETLNDLGLNVIVLVLGMYSCPDAADRNCLWLR